MTPWKTHNVNIIEALSSQESRMATALRRMIYVLVCYDIPVILKGFPVWIMTYIITLVINFLCKGQKCVLYKEILGFAVWLRGLSLHC